MINGDIIELPYVDFGELDVVSLPEKTELGLVF